MPWGTSRGRRELLALGLSLLLLTLTARLTLGAGVPERPPVPPGPALGVPGLWVWYAPRSPAELERLLGQARRAGMRSVFVKAADGPRSWRQFTPQLVDRLHAQGLHVCAWQYVYGERPEAEARAVLAARRAGAECLIIDAEAEYRQRGPQARRYLQALHRAAPDWPLALSTFPYVNLHQDFPYREFLRGGVGALLPQLYWQEMQRDPEQVVQETWAQNRALGVPVYPVGQTWQDPDPQAILRFRQALRRRNAEQTVSWWDWGQTSERGWRAISSPLGSG